MDLSLIKQKLRRGDLRLVHEMIGKNVTYSYVRMMFSGVRPPQQYVIDAAMEIIKNRERLIEGDTSKGVNK